jgi:hypothetical protein
VIREQLIKAHPGRDGDFRWRGDGVSRIEGLSDAVFGFAVTLLVVSLDGLEDGRTIVLNVALLFVVLFYIDPLEFLFDRQKAALRARVGSGEGAVAVAGA